MMNQMLVKETKELFKNYKIIMVPLIFIGILLMQPIVLKLLPTLLESNNNLPEGMVINIGTIGVSDVLGSILSQFEQLGVITIILIMMGTIVEERSSGVTAMVLVKPIGRGLYYFSKLIIYSVLFTISFFIAIGICGYYTEILYGGVEWGALFKGAAIYLPNLLLVVSIVLILSSFLKKQLAVAAGTFILYNILVIVPKYLGEFISSISPNSIVDSANKVLSGVSGVEFLKPVICVSMLSLMLILAGWFIFKKQEI